jgi:hypothetical protein
MTDEIEIRNMWRHRESDIEGFEMLEADHVPDNIIEAILKPDEYKAYLDWVYMEVK